MFVLKEFHTSIEARYGLKSAAAVLLQIGTDTLKYGIFSFFSYIILKIILGSPG